MHVGLRVVAVVGDTFYCGFQKRDDPTFAVGVGWRTGHPDGLGVSHAPSRVDFSALAEIMRGVTRAA